MENMKIREYINNAVPTTRPYIRSRVKYTPDDAAKIKKAYAEYKSLRYTAKKCNCCINVVRKALKGDYDE